MDEKLSCHSQYKSRVLNTNNKISNGALASWLGHKRCSVEWKLQESACSLGIVIQNSCDIITSSNAQNNSCSDLLRSCQWWHVAFLPQTLQLNRKIPEGTITQKALAHRAGRITIPSQRRIERWRSYLNICSRLTS